MASSETKFSFGVEIEFLVPILTNPAMDHDQSQDAEEYAATYAKAITIPSNEPGYGTKIRYRLLEPTRVHEAYVFHHIETFLDSLALPRVPGTRVFAGHDTTGTINTTTSTSHADFSSSSSSSSSSDDGPSTGSESDDDDGPKAAAAHTTWRAKRDTSLKLPDGRPLHQRYRGVGWVGVEVVSPALWFSPAGLGEVRLVCDAIKARYWAVFSPTCAVHVHVGFGLDGNGEVGNGGDGASWPPLRALRRTAALLFAADPLLAVLHPPHRREGRHCASNRSFSALAQGMTAEGAREALALANGGANAPKEGIMAPESLGDGQTLPPTATTTTTTTTTTSSTTTEPSRTFRRRIPRDTLRGYPQPWPGEGPRFPHLAIEVDTPQAMVECVEELLCASRRGVVATLMQGSRFSSRLAYSFLNFRERRKGDERRKRTVEFRQPAATLEADEVLAFVRLFVGLCRFAGEAEFGEVRAAIRRCAVADEAEGQGDFDVFDLLAQIGLVEEAEELQRIIMTQGDRMAPPN